MVGIIDLLSTFPYLYKDFIKKPHCLKYDKLEDIVNEIKNGKVNFMKYRNDDGISSTVMKDSQIYKEADKNVQNCIDFAGKIGNNLGDREIVHCFDDSNYYKNKNFNANHTSF